MGELARRKKRVASSYGDVPIFYIGKAELIANKKAAARPQDVADVAYLESSADG